MEKGEKNHSEILATMIVGDYSFRFLFLIDFYREFLFGRVYEIK